MAYVKFQSLNQLLMCLHERTDQFPSVVIREGAEWAVPTDILERPNELLSAFFLQRPWQVSLVQEATGKRVSLADEVCQSELVRYCDPLFVRPDQALQCRGLPIHFFLGAQNEKNAEETLKDLLACRTCGITTQAFSSPDGCGFCRLWSVQWHSDTYRFQPPTSALRRADRAWWGPVEGEWSPVALFVQWPYTLTLPPEILRKLNWGAACVLLSSQAPHVIRVNSPAANPTSRDLIEVAELQVAEKKRVFVEESPDKRSSLSFPVEMVLTEVSRRDRLERRRKNLQSQIVAKRAEMDAIARLSVSLNGQRRSESLVPEPLYLHGIQAPGRIPEPLRRIFLEWDPTDMAQIQHLRCSMPMWGGGDQKEVHILTTAHALGKADRSDVGLRLREYGPERGQFVAFELMEEWVAFGLRIFVPQGQHLALYPDLIPSEMAARKLTAALWQNEEQGNSEIGEKGCVLLMPERAGRIRALQIPNGQDSAHGFAPMSEAYRLECEVKAQSLHSMQVDPQTVAEGVKSFCDHVASEVRQETGRALEEWQQFATQELSQKRDGLLKELDLTSQALKERQDRVEGVKKTIRVIDLEMAGISQKIGDLVPRVRELNGMLHGRRGAPLHSDLTSVFKDLETLSGGVSNLLKAIQEV